MCLCLCAPVHMCFCGQESVNGAFSTWSPFHIYIYIEQKIFICVYIHIYIPAYDVDPYRVVAGGFVVG